MRLFIVDNNLVDKAGHFFAVDRWIKEEANKRGLDARFFINRLAEGEIIETLSARAIFSYRSYGGFSRDKYCADIDNLLNISPQFAEELQYLYLEGLSGEDIVFFPLVGQNDILGCALWLKDLPQQSRPYVCMNFIQSNFVNPQNDSLTYTGILYRSAAKILLKILGREKLIYTTHSPNIAVFLRWLLSHPVTLSPMPHTYNLPATQVQTTALQKISSGECRISIIGDSKSAKGFHLVPDLLELLTSKISKISFFVQVTTQHIKWEKEIARLQAMANVELHHGFLEDRDYLKKLQETDIILLPYSPLLYKYMVSGVFAESVAMGKVIVAPDSTWMAEHIKKKRGAGKLYNSSDAQSIANAVLAAITDYENLHSEAERYAETWKKEQNLGKYIDTVITTVKNSINVPS